ncbi:winged helix-turn-helix domain-containing protein, partial [Anaerosporobacter sp.]
KINQIKGVTIGFTKAEYDIIEFLSTNAGQVFDKERIYEKIYGYDATGDSRGITELVRRIRRKIAVYTDQECIETAWGIGYRWRK